jgi:hypothetical protein
MGCAYEEKTRHTVRWGGYIAKEDRSSDGEADFIQKRYSLALPLQGRRYASPISTNDKVRWYDIIPSRRALSYNDATSVTSTPGILQNFRIFRAIYKVRGPHNRTNLKYITGKRKLGGGKHHNPQLSTAGRHQHVAGINIWRLYFDILASIRI